MRGKTDSKIYWGRRIKNDPVRQDPGAESSTNFDPSVYPMVVGVSLVQFPKKPVW
jgi:hypothetical protein